MATPPITYEFIEETYICNDQIRASYGIAAYMTSSENERIIIASAKDLSSDRSRVLKLVHQCNRLHLSLMHFEDIIEDFLS